ncbi:hypothetical protein ACERK3_00755 [Phycisphaerales bacterium AB-hyl4]|uniref:Uncharacterized protein n=1 Tax=Natronomicrosphaera hydrolytica TaxID=3242702 RepID=A0ABV4TZP4_9BACT
MWHRRDKSKPLETRERMIAETEAFLSWALADRSQPLPRIPRRRVADGGYTELLRRPGARAAVLHWWRRVLNQ